MSYTQHEWTTGETITAAKLNNIEEGITEAAQSGGGGGLICTASYDEDDYVLDKTVQEIYDAFIAGTPVYIKYVYGTIGPSGTGSYKAYAYLARVTYMYSYAYTELIRIVASRPTRVSFNAETQNYSAGVVIFRASSMNEYPIYYKATYTPTAYLASGDVTGD